MIDGANERDMGVNNFSVIFLKGKSPKWYRHKYVETGLKQISFFFFKIAENNIYKWGDIT